MRLEEAWREGDDTIAFKLPDQPVQVMLSTDDLPPGPMYLVDDLSTWIAQHPGASMTVEPAEIPGGTVAGFAVTGGTMFYVFDMGAER